MDFETTTIPVDDIEMMDVAASPLSTADEINEVLDQLTEVNSYSKRLSAVTETEGIVKMDLETTPDVPSTKEVTKTLNQAPGEFQAGENLETTPTLCVETVGSTPLPNGSTTNIVSDKSISEVENETDTNESENEMMETTNAEVKMLKIASGSKKREVPPIPVIVMDSIRTLKRRSGASFEDIKKHMEENYPINVKTLIKYHVTNFLQKCVHNRLFQKTGGANTRFKIKEKSSQ